MLEKLKGYLAWLYIALVAGLYLLWRKEKDLHAEAEAKAAVSEAKSAVKQAEEKANEAETIAHDSRAEYERLARSHRDE